MANTTPTTNSLENYFLPFTANKDFKKDPRLLDRGEGVYYWNHKGDTVIDASSGLFCVPLGHGRKEIADAVHQQLLKLDILQASKFLTYQLLPVLKKLQNCYLVT